MINIFVSILVIVAIAAAIAYIVKSKKKGIKCIGCPSADTCPHKHDNTSVPL